jgi:hypothetical protein
MMSGGLLHHQFSARSPGSGASDHNLEELEVGVEQRIAKPPLGSERVV